MKLTTKYDVGAPVTVPDELNPETRHGTRIIGIIHEVSLKKTDAGEVPVEVTKYQVERNPFNNYSEGALAPAPKNNEKAAGE